VPQRQDIEKAWQLPAHVRQLETLLRDLLARPFHGTGPDGETAVPGLLVPDTSPVALHIADQLGQRLANGLFPGPHPLEGTQDGPDAVREERPEYLLHPGLGGPCRVVGVLERSKGVEVLAEMIVIQRLPHRRNVGVGHGPNPGGAIAQNLPNGDVLPAGLTDTLGDTGGQCLRRAQDTDIAAGKDGAEGRLLFRCFEPTHMVAKSQPEPMGAVRRRSPQGG
jgi:hypothetical protein